MHFSFCAVLPWPCDCLVAFQLLYSGSVSQTFLDFPAALEAVNTLISQQMTDFETQLAWFIRSCLSNVHILIGFCDDLAPGNIAPQTVAYLGRSCQCGRMRVSKEQNSVPAVYFMYCSCVARHLGQ